MSLHILIAPNILFIRGGTKLMKVENFDQARKLLSELSKFEDAQSVLKNYDAQIFASFCTQHNSNTKVPKEVRIPLPVNIQEIIQDYVSTWTEELKRDLESL